MHIFMQTIIKVIKKLNVNKQKVLAFAMDIQNCTHITCEINVQHACKL